MSSATPNTEMKRFYLEQEGELVKMELAIMDKQARADTCTDPAERTERYTKITALVQNLASLRFNNAQGLKGHASVKEEHDMAVAHAELQRQVKAKENRHKRADLMDKIKAEHARQELEKADENCRKKAELMDKIKAEHARHELEKAELIARVTAHIAAEKERRKRADLMDKIKAEHARQELEKADLISRVKAGIAAEKERSKVITCVTAHIAGPRR